MPRAARAAGDGVPLARPPGLLLASAQLRHKHGAEQLVIPIQQEPRRVPQQLLVMSAVTASRSTTGMPCRPRATAPRTRSAYRFPSRRAATCGPGRTRASFARVHGTIIGGNLLAYRPVEQPSRSLAKRQAQQRAKPLWRRQLALAVMDEKHYVALRGPGLRPGGWHPEPTLTLEDWQNLLTHPGCDEAKLS